MIKVIIYDKNMFTMQEFEQKLQAAINSSPDLESISIHDCRHTNTFFIKLRFAETNSMTTEAFTFGPERLEEIADQINATISVARKQKKSVLFSDVLTINKITRVVGFLILQKSKEPTSEDKSKKGRTHKKALDASDQKSE